MSLVMIGSLIGGVGLFLLGMRLMTEGLKHAAGSALTRVLERWTKSGLRGLLSGTLITSLVQSSSAVTVATIGFVNAGLMTLSQAVWVIYGSNIGTTMTGWLVALVGLDINIKAFALPGIGIGMALHLTGRETRRGAFGEALAGFGVFFVGIDVLKAAFSGLGDQISFESVGSHGFLQLLLFVVIGMVLTFLMQSSSAAMAVTLTATAGGVVPIEVGAAMVIGANVGTTSTALLSVIGATPNAKRVAAAHIAFNVFTGAVALAMLPFILFLLDRSRDLLGLESEPAAGLALFHTVFNLLGVALLVPVTPAMVRRLEDAFRTAEEEEARPRYLDQNVLSTPVLAIHALLMELNRAGDIARRLATMAVGDAPSMARISRDKAILESLVESAAAFANQIQRSKIPEDVGGLLPTARRAARDLLDIADLSLSVARARASLAPVENEMVAARLTGFRIKVAELVQATINRDGESSPPPDALLRDIDEDYVELKDLLVYSAQEEQLTLGIMVDRLDLIRDLYSIAVQCESASRRLVSIDEAQATLD
jgi:phosphate:Na+ symporter